MESLHPGALLKQKIEEQSLTLTEFAERANVSRSIVSQVCAEKSGYSLKTAQAFERVLNISADRWMFLLEEYLKIHPYKKHPSIIRHEKRMLNAYKKV